MIKNSVVKPLLIASSMAFSLSLAGPSMADHLSPAQTESYLRPVQLGISGSSQTLLQVNNLLYCYAGTLGSLVTDGNHQYVLSNNHVLAKENELLDYGDETADDTIIQEANLDEGTCSINSGDPTHAVAQLTSYVPVSFYKGKFKPGYPTNVADVAIALVTGDVTADGIVLGIGSIDGTAAVNVGDAVQKTGRTTAHTFGKIEATDVTLDVSYESGKARFTHQLRIRRPCDDAGFSDAGDSGSLIVTVPTSGTSEQAHAVGLLFAGGTTDTFANTIQDVFNELNGTAATSPVSVNMVSASPGSTDPKATSDVYANIQTTCSTTSGGGGGGGGKGGHGPHLAGGGPVGLDHARDVKARHSDEIMALPDVVGHGIGADANGNAVIEVYVSSKARRAAGRPFPTEFEGVPVRVIETGPVRAY